jgi:hypothetical protein
MRVVQGRMISDDEYKGALARKNPYQEWLKNQEITMAMLPKTAPPTVPADLHMAMLRAFGYTTETLEMLLQPMAFDAMEGLGSMGNDVPLACISQRPRTIFDYFKQLFAQVLPPPHHAPRTPPDRRNARASAGAAKSVVLPCRAAAALPRRCVGKAWRQGCLGVASNFS